MKEQAHNRIVEVDVKSNGYGNHNEEFISPGDQDKFSSATHSKQEKEVPLELVWRNIILHGLVHLASLYGIYLTFTSAMWQTSIFCFCLAQLASLGVTAGCHRLWSHRCYKAKLPLRIFLAFFFTISLQNDIYIWSRDHRVHHKYSDTNADPHNANRGFFFSHVGWLLCRKHPEVIKKGKTIDLNDLLADPIVRFQRKYYFPLVFIFAIILPTIIPMYMWSETLLNSYLVATILRLVITYNQTWLVNSAAHKWGTQPYDITIRPRQNAFTVIGAIGEGFHNYHHAFPYDYAASEYGMKYNPTTAFINVMAWLGLAYDRKTVSKDMIKARKLRTGEDCLQNTHQKEAETVKKD